MRLRAIVVLVVIFFIGAAQPARADALDEAKRAFAEGKAAFERGEYENALTMFQRADSLAPAPSLSYNIGTTYERLGRYHDAALAFDRYLNLAGVPQTDDEKQFQENLRARATADRNRVDRAVPAPSGPPTLPPAGAGRTQPRPVAPPPTIYPAAPPTGNYYNPYGNPFFNPGPSREERIKEARGRRARAIALLVIGAPMNLAGIITFIVGVTVPQGTHVQYDPNGSYYAANTDVLNATNGFEMFAGITLTVVGITLWAPGASSLSRANATLRELDHPASPPPPRHALMFQTPVFHF